MASPNPPIFTHIAMRCGNLDKSIAFYKRWCAFEVLHQRSENGPDGHGPIRLAWLGRPPAAGKNPEFVIVLLEVRTPPGHTSLFDHLGLSVESRAEVDRIAREAEPESILHWAAVDNGPIVGYLCAVKDPDGNVVEFSHGQKLGP